MACVNLIRCWTSAILHSFGQETDLLMKAIMKCVNIKLWDILGCFHYILNAPRILYLPKFKMNNKRQYDSELPYRRPDLIEVMEIEIDLTTSKHVHTSFIKV